jgi:hypothetical protein
LPPKGLYEKFIDLELLDSVAKLSNEYAMTKFGVSYDITSEDVNLYFAILLLSGYNRNIDYDLYWSQSKDCENQMVKAAVSRNRFRTIKKCIHFGSVEDKEGATPDKFKKVRMIVNHMQNRFSELFVPEQNLSHDEAMIKYFGKSGLKQAIRNKPIRFSFKAWVLATVSGYVVTFDLYQGKGIGDTTPRMSPLLVLLLPHCWISLTCFRRRRGPSPTTSSPTTTFPPTSWSMSLQPVTISTLEPSGRTG